MRLFVDTNIFLDVLLNRERHFKDSKMVMDIVKLDSKVEGYISEISLANIVYIARRAKLSDKEIRKFLLEIISIYNITSSSKERIIDAISFGLSDLEDSLQMVGALEEKCQYIITRDKKGFISSENLEVVTPNKFIDKFLDSD